ncbi:rifampicin phosphotransferase-like [Diadema setosum]|uniref:rifampicin phosphotransferase-like n=1 Tax=Diadema setosum TaxID=31175 RepID=UPI003B3B5036
MELIQGYDGTVSVPFITICVGFASFLALFFFDAFNITPPPLEGIYSQPGRWFTAKRVFIYLSILLRKWRSRRQKAHRGKVEAASVGYGQAATATEEDMEFITDVPDKPHGFNSVYAWGISPTGEWLVTKVELHPRGCKSCWFILGLPGIGNLVLPQYPDCVVLKGDKGSGFRAGGLHMEVVEPMRLWRISFNGLCKVGFQENTKSKSDRPLIHVRFSFMWAAFTPIFNFDTDLSAWQNGANVAREIWSREFFHKLKGMHQTHYEQYGVFRGIVKVEGQEERLITMRGIRDHSFGVRDWAAFYCYVLHFAVLEDGCSLQVGVFSIPGYLSHLSVGYLFMPNGVKCPLKTVDISLPKLMPGNQPPDKYSFTFQVEDGRTFWVRVEAESNPVFYMGPRWEVKIHERKAKFTVNGIKGWGISEILHRYDGGRPEEYGNRTMSLFKEPEPSKEDADQLVLPFDSVGCQSPKLVGGKGSQLAILAHLSESSQPKYVVPPGFCLTSAAFQLQLKSHPQLQEAISDLTEVSSLIQSASLEDTCNRVCDLFERTPLCDEVRRALRLELDRLFGQTVGQRRFAVRSSATGEDTSEMSAAGQLTTILGVKGYDKIIEAVQQCWASQFSFQAVQYRRQRGQMVESTMGVVVMEMVPSEASGVLFGQDPVDGNPAIVLINANYGLGESIVSGMADPDTIVLCRKGNIFAIEKTEVGSKQKAILMEDAGGTVTTDITLLESKKACISDQVALDLAEIALKLEEKFGDSRDIEWAYYKGTIYLLQARPITTVDMLTDYDLMHEFDTGLSTENEWLTSCNIQEMMPGSVTPLTNSVFTSAIDWSLQLFLQRAGGPPSVFPCFKSLATCCGKIFISLTKVAGMTVGQKDMMEIALLGQTLEEFTTADIESYHGQWKGVMQLIIDSLKMLRLIWTAKGDVDRLEKKLETYQLKDCNTASEMYQEISSKIPDVYEAWRASMFLSSISGSYSNILMAVLTKGSSQWQTVHYSAVAMMLSSCPNVKSADVPVALENIAKAVITEGMADSFPVWEPQSALEWLKSPESQTAGAVFKQFIQQQGHRCIRESEFREPSWKMEPLTVIPVVQSLLRGKDVGRTKKELSVGDALKQLKVPVTMMERMILRYFIPKTREAVGHREWGKSLAVKMHNHLKEGYWKLGQMMLEEGRLPDKDLIFFLTHREIGLLLKHRSPLLVSKAIRRRKLLPSQHAINFPEIFKGSPQPIEVQAKTSALVTLTGLPVCQGKVQGTAKVVTKLEDAGLIQTGDILIVVFTDVGWSPYFPLIRGLVTERGGLISHGAVVAREYGIPCVVNAKGATSSFQSGDLVELDGTSGTIKKLASVVNET